MVEPLSDKSVDYGIRLSSRVSQLTCLKGLIAALKMNSLTDEEQETAALLIDKLSTQLRRRRAAQFGNFDSLVSSVESTLSEFRERETDE